MEEEYYEEEWVEEGRGRSKKKRAAKAVEDLARRFVEMPELELKKVSTTEEIMAEIRTCRSTKGGSSRKRQIKHLAGIMRRDEEETEKLRAFLEGNDEVHLQETKAFHNLEELRDRLCNAELFPAALDEIKNAFPLMDARALTRLSKSVQTHGDKRAFREIFKRLRTAQDEIKENL